MEKTFKTEVKILMRGLAVFVAFFIIFSTSSLAIPSPMFPGNIICLLIGISQSHTFLASAVVNGLFYGFVAWIVFNLGFRWIERALSKEGLPKKK